MATLHQAIEETKNVAKWGAIAIVLIVLLVMGVRFGLTLKEQFFPTPPPPATVTFGKLPRVPLPESVTSKNLEYSVNTVTGVLPQFSDRVSIFKIIKNTPDLLALKQINARVVQMGFQDDPLSIGEATYQWSDNTTYNKKLTINIVTNNFTMTSDYMTNPDVLVPKRLFNETQAIAKSTAFLSSLNVLPNDIDIAKIQTALLSIQNGQLIPATSLSTTQIIKVSLSQRDVDNIPIVYPNPMSSTMQLSVVSGQYDVEVVAAQFVHQEIDITSGSGTYPILSIQEAFKQLQDNTGYIASYNGTGNQVDITSVTLNYYLGDKDQTYIWPVFTFSGSNGFVAYVPAIRNTWIEETQ